MLSPGYPPHFVRLATHSEQHTYTPMPQPLTPPCPHSILSAPLRLHVYISLYPYTYPSLHPHPCIHTLKPTPLHTHPCTHTLAPTPYTHALTPTPLHPHPYTHTLTPTALHPQPYTHALTPTTFTSLHTWTQLLAMLAGRLLHLNWQPHYAAGYFELSGDPAGSLHCCVFLDEHWAGPHNQPRLRPAVRGPG